MSDSHEKVPDGTCRTYLQELETLRALRASLESIKQVVQGVHDDLLVSQGNYTEIAGCLQQFNADERDSRKMDRDGRSS
jgi:hypothetical protein